MVIIICLKKGISLCRKWGMGNKMGVLREEEAVRECFGELLRVI